MNEKLSEAVQLVGKLQAEKVELLQVLKEMLKRLDPGDQLERHGEVIFADKNELFGRPLLARVKAATKL